jgi:hypothetical protein
MGDTTVIGNNAFEARIYLKSENELEWDITFQSRPNKNSWTFPIIYSGLDFSYQNTVYTQREIERNAYRPDSVKGSWIAFHKSRIWNEYKTGKAFHIYRPKAWDASGDTIWCDLSIDTVANEITLSIDRQWKNQATYPITIDPTFGQTSIPGSQIGVNNTWSYSNRYPTDVLGSDGTEMIKTLLFYYDPPSAGSQSYMALYNWTQADSCADSKIVTSSISVTDTDWNAKHWWPHAIEYSPSSNDSLTLAIGDFESGVFQLFYDTQSNAGDEITGDLPSTWGSCGTDDWRWGAYGTFDAEGPLFPTDNYLGTNWATPDSARMDDNLCATYNNSGQDFLCLHAFGFDIPTDATIDSFEVTVQSRGTENQPARRRYRVGLTKDSTNVFASDSLQQAVNAGACNGATNQITIFPGSGWSVPEVNDRGMGIIIYDNDTNAHELNYDAAWVITHFTLEAVEAETPWLDNIHSIDGAGKVQDVSDTTKVQHP